MKGLADKVIIVAGGATGIGAATAARLAEEGAKVVVGDLNGERAEQTAAELRGAGGEAVAEAFDISDEEAVNGLVARTVERYGGLNGVHVNAADLSPATVRGDTNALDIDLAVWDRTLHVNLRGHLLVTRAALPHLIAAGGGALVYTSSAAAFIGEPERPAYAASKAGINALVRHVASRWGREAGIRANAIAPGLVLSETVRGNNNTALIEMGLAIGRSPRLGEPSDIAAMAALLLSDDGEWINGQVLNVNGGGHLG